MRPVGQGLLIGSFESELLTQKFLDSELLLRTCCTPGLLNSDRLPDMAQ